MKQIHLNRTIHFKTPTGVLGACLSADGRSLAAACMDGVYLADLISGTSTKIGQHTSYVSSVAYLPVATASDSPVVGSAVSDSRVVDSPATKNESLEKAAEHSSEAGVQQIVSAGYDGMMQWIDVPSGSVRRRKQLHEFWSWDMAVSPNGKWIASVTGQYLSGGYQYEPLPEREPSVRLVSADTGEVLHSLPHVPSVQSVAFSADSQCVAAGNLMGEVRVWNCQTGTLLATLNTPDFTSWGIIKSHCYLGGIFALQFTPDSNELLLAGMGPMRDPMAGNGRQLWQKWAWKETPPRKVDETHEGESGEGLMEALALHPDGTFFVMAGRLRGGDWNAAVFDLATGARLATLKTGYRITSAMFTADGTQLVLAGTQGQPSKQENGLFPDFGRIEVYDVSHA